MSDPEIVIDSTEAPSERDPRRWIDPARELTRALVAILLFLLLAGEVAYGFFEIRGIVSGPLPKEEKQETARLVMDILNVVIPPTVALFGAATGFYYGTRASRS
jgi:hypothetical protein